ncbi:MULTISPECIES: acetyl-CoA carboxylase biotin carboxyl carrier protein [Deinococcus]|uniref:acetyl-CoA carboxylase biotin carboxyl carrier protein n=1 Tax=Deinococcus radiodurans TaxID=1299 RepID=UPI000484C548|nr:acetyl-CoA carboxylase biotin carboxyl carrier protein [Deinococcus radiodurans]ANC72595.1 acetyl-CoA carboxylase biotin carboxyl carrier protein subunit [Deinococcus radiodurans R1 = ATCC 13939 = DSM 20539]QEM72090.1 acetyl-CoA carboxylase biotin carboxyl carrier protein [Deinococcus radiodurans]QIP28362.1 acetyl-CoA carboxylase biotin carboxyl carrier protein [Deinococcus radiodurans]QIP30765.1 acetyl-CoA carboxylase biotin carboxyl carrier protein [Deinococcus radiodurans]UDK99324.1 acet
MNPDDLKKILDALTHADVREFALKTGSFDLALKRGPQAFAPVPAPSAPQLSYPQMPPLPQPMMGGFAPMPAPQAPAAPSAPAAPAPEAAPAPAAPAEAAPAAASAPVASAGTPVKAPIVGTFYSASSPDAAPYVKVGDRVESGQVLCIIEAMKLMNEIEAEQSGVIREILVKNAEPVEYGQTLFMIE